MAQATCSLVEGHSVGDTRSKIRAAALRLFIERGYARTSIADIEKAAGLAPRTGGFYRHFPSKAALAAEIGQASIIETRRDLGFDGVLPLGDTRAELVLIARGYGRAFERQAPVAGLIAEVRSVKEIRDLEDRTDKDLTEAFVTWLAGKPYARGKSRADLVALTLQIVGSWTLYLQKRSSAACPPELTDERMLENWADLWARILDGEDGPRSSPGSAAGS
jgi:AcrR family transcriptional regulator